MQLVNNGFDIIIVFAVFLFGMGVALMVRRQFNCSLNRALFLYVWHAFFCMVYAVLMIYMVGDAIAYYERSQNPDLVFEMGTKAVTYFTSIFTYYLDLSFLATFFVFHIFGYIGLLAFDGALRHITYLSSKRVRLLATLIVLLPSVSFWSSALGKDAIAFMATGLTLWAALDLRQRWKLLAFSLAVMLIVRPHVGGILLAALSMSFFLLGHFSLVKKVLFSIASVALMVVMLPVLLKFVGLDEGANMDSVNQQIEKRQGYNQHGGGSIDISEMSLPVQMFTYMFRPLPYEVKNLFGLLTSIENMFLMFLLLLALPSIFSHKIKLLVYDAKENRLFLFIFMLITWMILAMTTANLGIASRQKWMFTPIFLYFLFVLIADKSIWIAHIRAQLQVMTENRHNVKACVGAKEG